MTPTTTIFDHIKLRMEVNTMANVLDMQDEPQESPGTEKASNISLYRWCRNSFVSVSVCFQK